MRIAQVAPLYEAVPPRLYGGSERVVANLTDALVALGHDVDRLRAVALAGQAKSRKLFAPERQIQPRVAVIEREAGALGVQL